MQQQILLAHCERCLIGPLHLPPVSTVAISMHGFITNGCKRGLRRMALCLALASAACQHTSNDGNNLTSCLTMCNSRFCLSHVKGATFGPCICKICDHDLDQHEHHGDNSLSVCLKIIKHRFWVISKVQIDRRTPCCTSVCDFCRKLHFGGILSRQVSQASWQMILFRHTWLLNMS